MSNFDVARQFYNWAHHFRAVMDDILENLNAEELAALEKSLEQEGTDFSQKQEWMEKQARIQPVIQEKEKTPKTIDRYCPITRHSGKNGIKELFFLENIFIKTFKIR